MTIKTTSHQVTTHPGAITTLTYSGVTIALNLVRQLDQLNTFDWEQFEPIGRVRRPAKYTDGYDLEVLGIHAPTGALVLMVHKTQLVLANSKTDPNRDLRDSLTTTYLELPLIVLGD